MKKFLIFIFILSSTLLFSQQEDNLNLNENNKIIKERIIKLEKELKELKKELKKEKNSNKNDSIIQNLIKENKDLKKEIKSLKKDLKDLKDGKSKDNNNDEDEFKFKVYGYIKLDIAYDNSRSYAGNVALWIESEEDNENDDDLNITVNQTRIGLDIIAPEYEGLKFSGKIEIDFYGGGDENKPKPRLRHGYINIEIPEYQFSILAGQTWDIVSPLFPITVNFLVQDAAGNIGYRRPQLRLTKWFDFENKAQLKIQGAITRTIGDISEIYPSYLDSGEDAGFPTVQGNISFSFPFYEKEKFLISINGHWGQEEYDIDEEGHSEDFDTWSIGMSLIFPIIKNILKFKTELWMGMNLDKYYGGIVQGVNTTKMTEIKSMGGWFVFEIRPWEKYILINLGASIDDPDNDDLNKGGRIRNYCIFGNTFVNITDFFQIAVELSYWNTQYKGQDDGDDIRFQSAFILKF